MNKKVVFITAASCLPAAALAIALGMLRVAHGDRFGKHKTEFLACFGVVFLLLFVPVAIRSTLPVARYGRTITRELTLHVPIGAITGYVASLIAYAAMTLFDGAQLNELFRLPEIEYVALALLTNNYGWLVGAICFATFDIIIEVCDKTRWGTARSSRSGVTLR